MNKLENRLYNDLSSADNTEMTIYLLLDYYGSAYDKFMEQLEDIGIGSLEEFLSLEDSGDNGEDRHNYVLDCIEVLLSNTTLMNKFMNNLDK